MEMWWFVGFRFARCAFSVLHQSDTALHSSTVRYMVDPCILEPLRPSARVATLFMLTATLVQACVQSRYYNNEYSSFYVTHLFFSLPISRPN